MMNPFDALREIVRKLKPIGPHGFEGLMAAVLTDLTKRTFALASSGSQYGKDGASAFDGVIAFEGKLYDAAVPQDQVLSKIAQIVGDPEGNTELWILGSTGPVSSQHIKLAQSVGKRFGVTVQILAWPTTGLPDFAALLAMTPKVSAAFIAANTDANESEILAQFQIVCDHTQFVDRATELQLFLGQPSMAPAYALENNIAWLSDAFSSAHRARAEFGQALCPQDPGNSEILDRKTLRAQLIESIFGKLDGSVIAILGADGNGKSWAFAQAWAAHPLKPLTVVIVPEDVPSAIARESLVDLLIKKLLTQTGEVTSDESIGRWRKHFERWHRHAKIDTPRLIIFVDGLNQREALNWLRFIDAMSDLAANMGAKLVFSCRSVFYRDHLKDRHISTIIECNVPEWNNDELNFLLNSSGTSITKLDPAVVRSLRNPRIFSVAAMLLKEERIETFGELSVNWLLFEHIRTGATTAEPTPPPKQFVAKIRSHADDIVARLKQKQSDDIVVFDMGTPTNPSQFDITSAGRFFEVLPEDASKYKLKDEGLSLALGLALVNSACVAHRNERNVDDALSRILDPIAALDRTGDVLIGAVLAAILEELPAEIVTSLIRSFIGLQNIDWSRYEEFRALLRHNPPAFLMALEKSDLGGSTIANKSWLIQAIDDSRTIPIVADALNTSIHRWLSMFSTAADRSVATPNLPGHEEKRRCELEAQASKITEKFARLSQAEREVFDTMIREESGNYSRLNLLAFQFLARQPLATHAVSLRNWCLSSSFNGGLRHPHSDFLQLIRFNLVDWSAARQALLQEANLLREADISSTGKWALIYLLSATGSSDDAREAKQLTNELVHDDEPASRWRRIENYCSTDPCDPQSQRPENIDDTAQRFTEINVSTLRTMRGHSQEDFFFDDARPGLARFQADAAIGTMRRFADEAVTRSRDEFRTAAFFLEEHTAILGENYAASYIAKAAAIAQEVLDTGEDKNNEGWIGAQHALLIAFPHLTGEKQFEALIAHPNDATFIRELCGLFRPCDPIKLERTLEQAISTDNDVKKFRCLAFAEHSGTPLTPRFVQLAALCINSDHYHVRLSALGLIRTAANRELLSALASSSWSAAQLDTVKHRPEIMYGSEALVAAAKQGALSMATCLERIDLSAYEQLIHNFGCEASTAVAQRLDIMIRKASNFKIEDNLPSLELRIDEDSWPPLVHISDKFGFDPPQDHLTGDAWHQRQKLNRESAEQFERALVKTGSQLIMQFVNDNLITEIDKAAPTIVDNWVKFFLSLHQDALNNVHNVALIVAQVISNRDSISSATLFKNLMIGSPSVRIRLGRNRLPLEAVAFWRSAVNPEIRKLHYARLDRCRNDYDLSMEVVTALYTGREGILSDYVLHRRECKEPAHQARAITVAGFSLASPWALQTIEQFKDTCGFLHEAYVSAKYAMDRHQWSVHWMTMMYRATNPIDLWRYGILLSKIADGRIHVSDTAQFQRNLLPQGFISSSYGAIDHRIKRWKSHRRSKLFGMDAPDESLLPTLPGGV